MLSEVCRYLNNYFVDTGAKFYGRFEIVDGELQAFEEILQPGQYFRIIDSVYNDGIYQYPAALKDETFDGAVWVLKIPEEVVKISEEIDEWKTKYQTADSEAMSPYASESFGGYSYSKASDEGGVGSSWQGVSGFTARLEGWRRPRCRY